LHQPESRAFGRWRRQPRAGVAHGEHQSAAITHGAHVDAATGHGRLQAVLDAVLDQRLQQQRRHRLIGKRLGQIEAGLQPVTHADLHQREVIADPRELGP